MASGNSYLSNQGVPTEFSLGMLEGLGTLEGWPTKPLSHRPQQKSSLPVNIWQLAPAEQAQLASILLKSLNMVDKATCIEEALHNLNRDDTDSLANMTFFELALKKDIDTYLTDFAKLSSDAMMHLQSKNKPNLMHKFAKCIAECRPGSDEPLMPQDTMPFELIQYQIEFFRLYKYIAGIPFLYIMCSNSFVLLSFSWLTVQILRSEFIWSTRTKWIQIFLQEADCMYTTSFTKITCKNKLASCY